MPEPGRFLAGCIYYVDDEVVVLPDTEARQTHVERRPVLVVSDQNEWHGTNAQDKRDWPSVLVVPISHSTTFKTRFDVALAAGCGNLSKKGWVRIPALQPIDKTDLEDMLGQVAPETLDEVTAQILNYLGLIEPSLESDSDRDGDAL